MSDVRLLLRAELLRQWQAAHEDRCDPRWPHEGLCHWPPPKLLGLRWEVVTEDPNEGNRNV